MKYIIFLVYSRCLINIFILLQHIKFSLFVFFFRKQTPPSGDLLIDGYEPIFQILSDLSAITWGAPVHKDKVC